MCAVCWPEVSTVGRFDPALYDACDSLPGFDPDSKGREDRSGVGSTYHAVAQTDPHWLAMGVDADRTEIAAATMKLGKAFPFAGEEIRLPSDGGFTSRGAICCGATTFRLL